MKIYVSARSTGIVLNRECYNEYFSLNILRVFLRIYLQIFFFYSLAWNVACVDWKFSTLIISLLAKFLESFIKNIRGENKSS